MSQKVTSDSLCSAILALPHRMPITKYAVGSGSFIAYKEGHHDARQAAAELVAGSALIDLSSPIRWLMPDGSCTQDRKYGEGYGGEPLFTASTNPAKAPDMLTLENAPIGTKAPAASGGFWIRTEKGWMWLNGGTFPRPGGDWTGKLILPESEQDRPVTMPQQQGNAIQYLADPSGQQVANPTVTTGMFDALPPLPEPSIGPFHFSAEQVREYAALAIKERLKFDWCPECHMRESTPDASAEAIQGHEDRETKKVFRGAAASDAGRSRLGHIEVIDPSQLSSRDLLLRAARAAVHDYAAPDSGYGSTKGVMDDLRDAIRRVEMEPGEGGWIAWNGGACPVDYNTIVDIMRASGKVESNVEAGLQSWGPFPIAGDIASFRIVKEA